MRVACERIRAAIAEGRRICVHGDYDVDGICATALAVLLLRELGADVDWHLPSRFDEGYGVSRDDARAARRRGLRARAHRRLRDHRGRGGRRGAGARARGDRHRPSPARATTLPDCPIVATRPSDYPFPELCGTGVVYKLGQALFGVDSEIPKRHLDLVALATIADVVPLARREPRARDRRSARARAHAEARAARADARRAASIRRASTRARVGFRLAPRINAAGRLGHPRAALELLLTDDADEARRLAERARGAEPRAAGGRGPHPARGDRAGRGVAARSSAARRAYVVAGEDWHEGVIGIVASRLVERFNRPVVLIAGGGTATGRAPAARSRRSTCTAALGACSALLGRWGGHRAAAGLSIKPENVEAFAAAFAAHAAGAARRRGSASGDARRRDRPARHAAHARPVRASSRGSRRSGSATRR